MNAATDRRTVSRPGGRRHVSVARERGASYDVAGAAVAVVPPRPTAAAALAQLDAALAALGDVDWSAEDDEQVNDVAVGLQRRVNRLQAAALAPLTVLQRRGSFGRDGAVTAASWLRSRANLDAAAASRLCTAARRLPRLPRLADAFAAGDVSLAHVTAVTEAAVPNRFDAIAAVEQPLVELACRTRPRSVHIALRRVRDAADVDGSSVDGDEPAMDADESDPRRFWRQHRTLEGMTAGEYLVDGVLGEMLAVLFDAFATADPSDTPLGQRRSPAQKRVDAVRAALTTLLDAGLAPTVQGNKAHLLLMVDLLTVMGRDQAATFAAELARSGRVSPATIARLGVDAKVTPVLTMGPWRIVAVGRTHRTLPHWLRPLLQMLHRRCRGPDCDRPVAWTQAHHQIPYSAGGDTDLNTTIPLCKAHHDLVTTRGWTVTLDLDDGICTWTAPNGRTINTAPPR